MKILDITTLFAIVTPLTGCGRGGRNRRLLRGPSPRLDAAARLRRRQAPNVTPLPLSYVLATRPKGDDGVALLFPNVVTGLISGGGDQSPAVVDDCSVALMHQIIPGRLQ